VNQPLREKQVAGDPFCGADAPQGLAQRQQPPRLFDFHTRPARGGFPAALPQAAARPSPEPAGAGARRVLGVQSRRRADPQGQPLLGKAVGSVATDGEGAPGPPSAPARGRVSNGIRTCGSA